MTFSVIARMMCLLLVSQPNKPCLEFIIDDLVNLDLIIDDLISHFTNLISPSIYFIKIEIMEITIHPTTMKSFYVILEIVPLTQIALILITLKIMVSLDGLMRYLSHILSFYHIFDPFLSIF